MSEEAVKARSAQASNAAAQEEDDEDVTPMTVVSTTVRTTGTYSLKEGDMLGSYRIRKPLGKGGMGEVYLALHTKLNVLRAIKILPARFCASDKHYGERFLQEARLAIQMEHPNVISVFDAEYDEKFELYYSVMEFVDGGTVRTALRSMGAYAEKPALMIAMKVSEALMAAEKAGLVHRDIKPDNIMLTRNGVIKLADLGIAKTNYGNTPVVFGKSHVSLTGTPAYMSPEQITDPTNVDIRADIYSLGATLYEMLTGAKPYPGSKAVDIIKAAMESPVPDPCKLNPQISKRCGRLVMKMMAKNRDERQANAVELNKELKGLLTGAIPVEKVAGKADATPDEAIRRKSTNPTLDAFAALVYDHWLQFGITIGMTFFLLCAIAFLIMRHV